MVDKISVVEHIFSANEKLAEENRALFDQADLLALNFMASPGAGKTSLIEAT
jgi:hydrogenase nickel incorporation protein HypB